MTEKLKQIIQEEVTKLPKEKQEAINALDWENIVEEISKKYLLTENEMNDFQVETLLVLIGLNDLDFYATNIENNVGTGKNEAEKIAEEVNQKIFTPIYDALTKKIEGNLKNKNPNWQQTLDFIVSGGDYSAYIEDNKNQDILNNPSKAITLDNSKKIEDIKNKFTI